MKEKTMNYWLHRVAGHEPKHSLPLLEKGYISIGFLKSANEGIFKIEHNENTFSKFVTSSHGEEFRARFNLFRFFDMKKGDTVIVPLWGEISIYKIMDDKPIIASTVEDLGGADIGFLRKVERIEANINRGLFLTPALIRALKFRGTNLKLNHLKDDIEEAIVRKRDNKSINLSASILNKIAIDTLNIIKANLNTDFKFEQLVQWYLTKTGANDVYINIKNEKDKTGDADVTATFEAIKTIIYVQAKYHDGITSNWAVEQITDYLKFKERDDSGYSKQLWVVSTCDSFSEEAIKLANFNNVRLFNGIEFVNLMLLVGLDKLDTAFDKKK